MTITHLADQARPLDDEALTAGYAPPSSPWLRVNLVTSIDGAVAVDGVSGGLSGPPDQHLMGLLRMQCDAVLLGAGTLRVEGYGPLVLDEPHRDWRRSRGLPAHPTLVVVSGSLQLEPAWSALADAPVRPVVLTHAGAPAARREKLATVADVLTAGADTVDLTAAVALLHRRGLRQLLSEGGPHLLGGLTAADLVDEVCLTLSPLLAGPGAGRIVAGTPSPLRRLALRHVLTAQNMVFLRYQRSRPGADSAHADP